MHNNTHFVDLPVCMCACIALSKPTALLHTILSLRLARHSNAPIHSNGKRLMYTMRNQENKYTSVQQTYVSEFCSLQQINSMILFVPGDGETENLSNHKLTVLHYLAHIPSIQRIQKSAGDSNLNLTWNWVCM